MLIDLVAAVAVILGFMRGFGKGLIKSIASFLAIILGVIAATNFGFVASEYLGKWFNINPSILPIVSAIAMFILVLLIITVISNLVDKFLNIIMLGLPNKIAGGALYAFAAVIIVSALLNTADAASFIKKDLKDDSKSYVAIQPVYPWFQKMISNFTPADRNLFDNYKLKVNDLKDKLKNK